MTKFLLHCVVNPRRNTFRLRNQVSTMGLSLRGSYYLLQSAALETKFKARPCKVYCASHEISSDRSAPNCCACHKSQRATLQCAVPAPKCRNLHPKYCACYANPRRLVLKRGPGHGIQRATTQSAAPAKRFDRSAPDCCAANLSRKVSDQTMLARVCQVRRIKI